MKFQYRAKGELHLIIEESDFDRLFFKRDRAHKLLTIAWNRGSAQTIIIDEVSHTFPANSIVPLVVNQSFRFEKPEQIVAWQYNRDFYCIVDHDKEVSCVGFLFYGTAGTLFIQLDETTERKLNFLLQVFIDEFQTEDNIQGEMLMMLLKRLIILCTRWAKQQYITTLSDDKMEIIRKFNLLVEDHYHAEHSVQFYAEQLHKSPKTLSNLFAIYNQRSPLTIIQDRVVLEARRLLTYTDKSSKEIAFEIGFEDAAHFSHFFKKQTGQSPTGFRQLLS
jgi:AraC family transcriptional regulator, transcriptional activator of pobA